MAKKKDQQLYFILGILALIVIVYGGSQGWFQSLTISGDTINMLENPPDQIPGQTCSLSISPTTITMDQSFVGTIKASPNTFCEVFGKYQNQWQKVFEGTTDANGKIVQQQQINLVGDFIFRAICESCVTNEASLRINPSATTDTDNDGIPDVTDNDDDNDGYDDNFENQMGSDPLDPNSVPSYDCNQECIDRNYKSGREAISCTKCLGDDVCITLVTDQHCCCDPKDEYPEESYTLLTCGVSASATGFSNYALGIYNLDDCISHGSSQCSQSGLVLDDQDFFSPNCCVWNCVSPPNEIETFTSLTCAIVALGNGYDESGIGSLNEFECMTQANTGCYNLGRERENYEFFTPNCCGWNCGVCNTDACCLAISGYDYGEAGYNPSEVGDCYIWAETQCGNIGGDVAAYNVVDGCCVWECW